MASAQQETRTEELASTVTAPLARVHGRRRAKAEHHRRPRSSRITIVLAEGEHLIRCGIRCLLEREDDFRVVGEAEDGLQVAGLVARLKPRILVVAVAMPGLNGLDIARQICQQSSATAVVILSRFSKEEYVVQALRNGASGYVVKCARPPELVRAIRRVVAGRRYLSEPFSEHSVDTWLQRAQSEASDAYETLTDRERQVLQLVSEGHSSTIIGNRLSISSRTVEAHRASVMRKMGFSNLVDVIVFAIARGILVRPLVRPYDPLCSLA